SSTPRSSASRTRSRTRGATTTPSSATTTSGSPSSRSTSSRARRASGRATSSRPRRTNAPSRASSSEPPPLAAAMLRRLLLLAAAALLAGAPPARAQRTLAIERFDAEILVHRDGSVAVTERITVRFDGAWNGIYRSIPVEYRAPWGLNYTLRLRVDSITDGAGNALEYESSRERHYRKLKIWVPGAQDATRTVVLHYRTPDALRFSETHDELYWNVTGDEWEAPIHSASARVLLPSGIENLRTAAFTGAYGST